MVTCHALVKMKIRTKMRVKLTVDGQFESGSDGTSSRCARCTAAKKSAYICMFAKLPRSSGANNFSFCYKTADSHWSVLHMHVSRSVG